MSEPQQADHAVALRRAEEEGYARGLRDAFPTKGWQPIETAPKDGTTILVGRWDNGMTTVYSDHWAEDPGCWCDSSGSFQPTHWMPLPEPPK